MTTLTLRAGSAAPLPTTGPNWSRIALPRLPALPSLPAGTVHFALTASFAALLALFVAFWLELDSPSSAMTTVLIVASPVRGMVLSKSLYRLLGTIIGAVASIALIDIFSQTPELLFPVLGLWVGLCTGIATLLRNFRAYAAVLAGYTVALIGMASIAAPAQVWDITIARVAAITVGIVCAGVASSLFSPGGARRDLMPRIRDAIRLTLALARDALDRDAPAIPERRYVEVAGKILNLDTLVEYAATESPAVARRANAVRSAAAALLAAVTATRALAGEPKRSTALIRDLREALDEIAFGLTDSNTDFTATFAAMRERLARSRGASDDLADLIAQLEAAMLDLDALANDRPARSIVSLGYHRDLRAAFRNGARAWAGVAAAGAFCFLTGWSDGMQMVLAVAVVCSLLALLPNPAKASVGFAIGVALGVVAGTFCQFFLLTKIDGFPLLVLMVAPFLLAGLFASTNPKYAGIAGGYLIFFVQSGGLANPMGFDVVTSLNNALAFIVGALLSVVIYRVLLPVNAPAEARRLVRAIEGELAILSGQTMLDRAVVESRIYHRLGQLMMRLGATDEHELLATAFAQARAGLAALRVRATTV